MGKPIIKAILDGAQQIAVPAFVSTLCICIVFVPVIFLSGAARYLFTPLALAVVLAMHGVLPALAHAGAHHGPVPAARRSRPLSGRVAAKWSMPAHGFFAGIHHGFQTPLREHARRLPPPARLPRWRIASWWPPASALIVRRLRRAASRSSARISFRKWTPARSGCTCALRRARASKRPEALFQAGGRHHPPNRSARRTIRHSRQYRPALQRLQHRLQRYRHHRLVRRRNSGFAQAGRTPPPGITSASCAVA